MKRMTGYKHHYKVRFGDYRVGLFKKMMQDCNFLRVLNRKEIYKFFP